MKRKIILVGCEDLKDIYELLSYAYLDENTTNIFMYSINKINMLFASKESVDILAFKLFNIFYNNLVFNLIKLSLSLEETNSFIALYYNGLRLEDLIIIDTRLFNILTDGYIIPDENKDDVYNATSEFIKNFIVYLTSNDFKYKEELMEDIIECYKCFYAQLSNEVINNFSIAVVNNDVLIYVSS